MSWRGSAAAMMLGAVLGELARIEDQAVLGAVLELVPVGRSVSWCGSRARAALGELVRVEDQAVPGELVRVEDQAVLELAARSR